MKGEYDSKCNNFRELVPVPFKLLITIDKNIKQAQSAVLVILILLVN